MSNFTPNTKLYGRQVTILDEQGKPGIIGTLTEIRSPFDYLIDGINYTVGETDKFFEDDGDLYLQAPTISG